MPLLGKIIIFFRIIFSISFLTFAHCFTLSTFVGAYVSRFVDAKVDKFVKQTNEKREKFDESVKKNKIYSHGREIKAKNQGNR
jgi:hypothetical protein